MTVLDPNSGLPAFLIHFDSLEFNSLPATHFHCFEPPFVSFLQFFVPIEGLPLLEGLFKAYGDFTNGFRRGVFLDNILMELLCVVLISLKDSSPNSLFEGRLLEWRGMVQGLIETKFNLSFLLEYLRSLAHTLFQRKASRDLDEKATGPFFPAYFCSFPKWLFVGWPYTLTSFFVFSLFDFKQFRMYKLIIIIFL